MRIGGCEILGELGRGGMGVVYRAHDPLLAKQVAVKVLGAGAVSETSRKRFLREAQVLAKLRHPNIVTVHRVGEHQMLPFLVMDLLPGESLQRRLDGQGSLEPPEAARIALGVARALDYAHEHGVLHRDVKPDNIILDPGGTPLLTDFGLALDIDASYSRLSKTGRGLGSPGYWPPEQARGAKLEIDRRSDVYAVGATLYALLTRQPPFLGERIEELIVAALEQEPTPPSHLCVGLDATLEAICLKCLEKDPARRYPSAQALADALEDYLEWGDRPKPGAASRRRGLLVVGVLVLLLVGLALWFVLFRRMDSEPLSESRRTERSPHLPKTAGQKGPADPFQRGLAFLAKQDYRQAIGAFSRAIELDPDDVMAHINRGVARYQQGDLVAAVVDYDRAIELDPDNADAFRNRGLARIRGRQYRKAIADFSKCIELEPKSHAAYSDRGNAHTALREFRKAMQDYSQALRIDPRQPVLRYNRGRAWLRLGDPRAGIKDFDEGLKLDPSRADKIKLYTNRGVAYGMLRDYLRSIADYDRALALDKDSAQAYYNRARAKSRLGRSQEALEDYGEAIRCDPRLADAYYNRGTLLGRLKQNPQALADLNQSLKLEPNAPARRKAEVYRVRAVIYLNLGRTREAIADWDKCLAVDDKDAPVYASRGSAKETLGDRAGALSDYRQALAHYPPGHRARGDIQARIARLEAQQAR